MSSVADMAKVSARSGFHLLWGLIVSRCHLIGRQDNHARLLGSDLYCLYAIVLTAPSFIAIFRD